MSTELPAFVLPGLSNNADAWGPNCSDVSVKNDDALFQPYSKDNKSERHWKISDWTVNSKGRSRGAAGAAGLFAYKNEDDESNFNFVDNKPRSKPLFKRSTVRGATNFRPASHNNANRGNFKPNQTGRPAFRGGRNAARGRGGFRRTYREEIIREPSIPVKNSWELVQTIAFNEIPSSGSLVPEVTDLCTLGAKTKYIKSYDLINPRRAKIVSPATVSEYSMTASVDPTIASFVARNTADVYATEAVISLLMAATSTVQSWDLLITKNEKGLFIDKRPDSKVCATTVHETSSDVLPTEAESINSSESLCTEATALAQAFAAQVFDASTAEPMESSVSENSLQALYRYRSFNLGGVSLLVRAIAHGVVSTESDEKLVLARMVNEFDSKVALSTVDWRSKMEIQPGAILAGEIKNNTSRMLRIVSEAFLAGVDLLKLGYVSRVQTRDDTKHELLKVETYEPRQFIEFMQYTVRSLWSSLKFLINEFLELENGKYVVLRDPSLPQLQVYKVAETTFDVNGVMTAELEAE